MVTIVMVRQAVSCLPHFNDTDLLPTQAVMAEVCVIHNFQQIGLK